METDNNNTLYEQMCLLCGKFIIDTYNEREDKMVESNPLFSMFVGWWMMNEINTYV
jgi:hypothetical protein